MGAECHQITQSPLSDQISKASPLQHPLLGFLLLLHSDKSQKAIKIIHGSQSQCSHLIQRAQLLKESGLSVSTLLQVYSCDRISQKQVNDISRWKFKLQMFQQCHKKKQNSSLMLQFQYIQPQDNLQTLVTNRMISLSKISLRQGKSIISSALLIKMCDYQQIDSLPSQQRQVVNHFFQEIEVVRMLDHIVGALYFLHHYDIPYGAVRPELILLDREGKYILPDRELFVLKTNYQICLQCLNSKDEKGRQNNHFLSPQWLYDLRQRQNEPSENGQKSDIFCLGLVALKLCLLSQLQMPIVFDKKVQNFVINSDILTNQLNKLKSRYSKQLVNLLKKMLKMNPQQRIDYVQLIDQLNPVLINNLQKIKELHSPSIRPSQSSKQHILEKVNKNHKNQLLKEQLINIEKKFQKVMARRAFHVPQISQDVLKQQQKNILQKLELLKSKKDIDTRSTTIKREPQQRESPLIQKFELAQTGRDKFPRSQYLSGEQLQQIVWQQYQNMKSRTKYE